MKIYLWDNAGYRTFMQDAVNRHAMRAAHVEGANTVVVFIHGILGSPTQFEPLLTLAVDKGYSAVSLLLPGHGGSGKAFRESNASQWEAHVSDQIIELSARYASILMVGHSMGGLLAIQAALKYPKINGLFCIALPLHLKISLRSLRMSAAFMLHNAKHSKHNATMQAALAAHSIAPASFLDYISWLPNFMALSRLAKKTRAVLGALHTAIVLCFCAKDESVSRKSIRAAHKGLTQCDCKIYELPHAGHFFYSDADQALLRECFLTFLEYA